MINRHLILLRQHLKRLRCWRRVNNENDEGDIECGGLFKIREIKKDIFTIICIKCAFKQEIVPVRQ